MYDLEKDLGEQNNVLKDNEVLAQTMKETLMDWLQRMDTQYAAVDTAWDQEARTQRLNNHKNVLMPRLEKRRQEMLSPDWQPNDDWWGSKVAKQ